jgi:hypothetical protein
MTGLSCRGVGTAKGWDGKGERPAVSLEDGHARPLEWPSPDQSACGDMLFG